MGPGEIEDTGGRRALRELERSEERFRMLVESVVDYAIFMLSPDGTVASWNIGAERIKGYSQDAILGRHISVFYPEETEAEGLPDQLLAVARDEGRVADSGWRVRADGSRFWANVVITALRDDDGTLVGFAKVTRDMTEAHEAQAARERALREQRRAVERLEELDEWRRDFLSTVAHDLQTPVSAIAGFADILLTDEDVNEAERRDLLERIAGNAGALNDLIRNLRTFSSLESGRVELDREPLGLADEVETVVAGMEPVLGGHDVQIDVDELEVSADRRGLHRILQNLLSNAARHSPHGAPIRIHADAGPDGTVVVEVRDEGEGIAEDVLPRVFDRYQRGEHGGTGLGLTIVQQHVELHGGEVDAESAEGAGATFRFTLPGARSAVRPADG